MNFYNHINSVEIQNNTNYIGVFGDVFEHIDIKNNTQNS